MAVDYWNQTALVESSFLLCVFIIACAVMDHKKMSLVLVSMGLFQAGVVFGQFLGLLPSRHGIFAVTGFMENPGQMGGFQSVAFVCCLNLIKEYKKHWIVVVGIILFISLRLSDSRAGWVAAIVGSLFIYNQRLQDSLKRRIYIIPLLVVAFLAIVILLYFYRSDSVNARLLIWRVSFDMIADRPLMGVGLGNFSNHYMLYQADYFLHHPAAQLYAVADNVIYPFNEYIKIAVEIGLPGVIAFVCALYALWRSSKKRNDFAPMLTLLVFGFFSYPSDKLLLASLLPLIAGTIVHDNFVSVSHYTMAFCVIIALVIIYDTSGIGLAEENYGDIPNCENWCCLGESCEQSGEYKEAEAYYLTASYMIPTRMRPNYLLWRLYRNVGREEDAREVAQKILTMPLKVENTFTLRVKNEVRSYYGIND